MPCFTFRLFTFRLITFRLFTYRRCIDRLTRLL